METKKTAPRSLGRQINFAAAATNTLCNDLLAEHGLTLAQWAVLSCIWRNGALSLKDIATLTGNAPPAASRIVDRMIPVGLVERVQDSDDRRAVIIDLGPRGQELNHLRDFFETVNAALTSGFSEAEVATLFELLSRVEANARAQRKASTKD